MVPSSFLEFERAKFRTRLPRSHAYTAGHAWLRSDGDDLWHVGLTRFALRMLGEPVDLDFEAQPGASVEKGQVLGWMEGFKAVTDLYAPMAGEFAGANPALDSGLDPIHRSAYERGWLYSLRGPLDPECLDVDGYAGLLEVSIDKMVGEEQV